ncbi:MAG: hypothetical protein CMM23_11960 [Rhodospirillaceae bacterium]|nr:hypothetical protein [Rhodospirillaceae bacterium]
MLRNSQIGCRLFDIDRRIAQSALQITHVTHRVDRLKFCQQAFAIEEEEDPLRSALRMGTGHMAIICFPPGVNLDQRCRISLAQVRRVLRIEFP